MEENIKVSTLIPFWNSEKYIKECIDSCLRQTYSGPFEIILVDDGSTDNSKNIVLQYNDDRIHYYYKEHSGVANSLNYGLQYCKGEYISRMDSDDIMLPYRLMYQISYMDTHKYVDILANAAKSFDCNEKFLPWKSEKIELEYMYYNGFHPCHSTIIFRKSNIQNKYGIQFYSNEFRWEDTELWLRCLADNLYMYHDRTPVIMYRKHPEQVTAQPGFCGDINCGVFQKYKKYLYIKKSKELYNGFVFSRNIPKVIHYCWFGKSELPEYAQKCIESWKQYMPDYEIKRWDETNFDVNMFGYAKKAYDDQNYAHVSDVCRLWVLYNYGGIYLDTDVEMIKSWQPLVDNGPFTGFQVNDNGQYEISSGLGIACYKHQEILGPLLTYYKITNYNSNNNMYGMATINTVFTDMYDNIIDINLNQMQKLDNFTIYPTEYLSPMSFVDREIHKTDNTYSIHWYASNWGKYKIENEINR